MEEMYKAVILGIVEGVTEFLPVSSTGHMILVGDAIAFTGPRAESFEVFIQLGAILAVVYLYAARFRALMDLSATTGFRGRRGLMLVGAACVPVLIVGKLFHHAIKEQLFYPLPVAVALIVGGLAMIVIETFRREPRVRSVDDLTLRDAFVVGTFQCFALWPGMSRSGSTMIGALLSGVERRVAAEFSFLVSVPVMCAAVTADMVKSLPMLSSADIPLFSVGFVVSFVVALIAVKSFIALLGRFTLRPFGVYRIILGVIVLTRLVG
jgi:undecaprenyl-diphosphatase